MIWAVAVAVAASCVASLGLTALMRLLAPRVGLVDCPDGVRKLHGRPTALGGGVAVFLATTGVLAALLILPNPAGMRLQEEMPECVFLFLASLVIVLVGVADDRWGIRGRYKLLGQLVAASILIVGGLVIEKIAVFGWEFHLGLLAIPFTLFWLLGTSTP